VVLCGTATLEMGLLVIRDFNKFSIALSTGGSRYDFSTYLFRLNFCIFANKGELANFQGILSGPHLLDQNDNETIKHYTGRI
jgi:hypothetical protein